MNTETHARRIVGAAFVVTLFLVALDTTAVNVALVVIAGSLHVPLRAVGAISIAYFTGAAALMPVAGSVADRFGHRRTALVAVGAFTACSAGCAAATNVPMLAALRAVQGAGSGVLVPVVTGALMRANRPEHRARAARVLMIGWVTAPAVGPLFGGWCATTWSWRWIFVVNVPLGLALTALLALSLRGGEPGAKAGAGPGRPDLQGWLLCAIGFGLVFYALGAGAASGWAGRYGRVAAVALAAGVVAVIALVATELRHPDPVLRLRLFAEPEFALANAVSLIAMAAFAGMLYAVPLLVQDLKGGSALRAGTTVLAEALGVQSTAQLAGALMRWWGTFRVIGVGLAGTASAFVLLATVGMSDGPWPLRGCVFTVGVCMGLVFAPLQVAGFDRVRPDDLAHASALMTTQRQLAGALGVALTAVMLYAGAATLTIARCRVVFVAAGGLALAAGLLALLAPAGCGVRSVASPDELNQPADVLRLG